MPQKEKKKKADEKQDSILNESEDWTDELDSDDDGFF